MKAMHIERHNAAARLILKEILRGTKGNHYVVADIGSSEKMRGLGAFDNRINRIVSEQDMETLGYEPSIRDKLRPDILLILLLYRRETSLRQEKADHKEHYC